MTTEWARPGVYEELPGVYRIPLPLPEDGLRAVNVYALAGEAELVLIDSGWARPESRQALVEALATLGRGVADISRFLVTHMHRDHYTQAVALRREFGMPVSLGIGEKRSIEIGADARRPPFELHAEKLRRLGADDVAGQIVGIGTAGWTTEDGQAIWEHPDHWLAGAEVLPAAGRSLQVVPTPGHTNGHVVFHDEAAAALFAGDHVLPEITPSIGFDAAAATNPLRDFLSSLALVRSRPDALLLPAHGPVRPSVHARIDELVDHHGARLEETEKAVAGGADTARLVAAQLGWTRRERRLADLDPVNAMLAIFETEAHLALLASQGRLHTEDVDGVRHYRVA